MVPEPQNAHFEWTESMTVGEPTIDAQHKRLLAQLNAVIDAMIHGPNSKEVADAVAFFGKYADEHLAYEEAYMIRRKYSGLAEHLKRHQDFRDTYQRFKMKLADEVTPDRLLTEMEVYLGDWWTEHIRHEDKKYYEELGPAAK